MSKVLVPIILCGGNGSRLWPLSRSMRPKQFLGITEDKTSLFQLTLMRLEGLLSPSNIPRPWLVANADHRFLVAEQCRTLGVDPLGILLEPVAKNTAAAIASAAFAALDEAKEDPVLLVLPSDHTFANVDVFQDALRVGLTSAQQGSLVTFGITPTHAEIGYGYVQTSKPLQSGGACPVARFVEKPNLETAQGFVQDGSYLWNSGMFMFKASVFLAELKAHQPHIYEQCQLAWQAASTDLSFIRLDPEAFTQSPALSVDHAVMEKTKMAVVVPLDAGWSDVGAWPAVQQVLPQDIKGNAVRGDVLLQTSANCHVHADSRLVTLVGVNDMIVVETSDAVLVAHKDSAQDVKTLVERMKALKRTEVDTHREVFRPWGSYDAIDQGERFQVKRIKVQPGAKLSVQMHHHRAEHWVVVAGTAKVTIDDKTQLVTENQSVYIPIGAVHSLENPGKMNLHLIEVQSGAYLGEDDIVRFQDNYGRA